MKNKITFDSGVKQYEINGRAVLRFNPSDPNLYKRFKEIGDYLVSLEKEVSAKSKDAASGMDMVELLSEYDGKVKEKLRYVFGQENDFEDIFEGENIMALASNGALIITNFLDAMRPIIEKGIKGYAKLEAERAVKEANAERSSR